MNKTHNPIIIGLTGPAGSGKDTLAQHLVKQHGFTRIAYADPIKDALEMVFCIESRYLYLDKEANIPGLNVSGRHLMQTLGTEWGRDQVHPDFWVLLLKRRLADMMALDDITRFVISDVRFDNEADWIREQPSGYIWHLDRAGRNLDVREHVSEEGVCWWPKDTNFINYQLPELFKSVDQEIAEVVAHHKRDL